MAPGLHPIQLPGIRAKCGIELMHCSQMDATPRPRNVEDEEALIMNSFNYNAMALMIGAVIFLPLSPSTARADDDDWEDRWEEYEDAREEAREEHEEWLEDREEALEELHERDSRWYRHHSPDVYRVYRYPSRHYRHHDGRPVYRYYYPEGRRVYRYYDGHPRVYHYGGQVHAGPVDVYYGRHGSVHVGPVHVHW